MLIASLLAMAGGVVTLLYGRKLYWFFVGLGGFLVGLGLTSAALADWNPILVMLIALVIGVALAALALVARRPLAAVGAFLGVGFLVIVVCEIFGIGSPWRFILAAIAGTAAAVAMFIAFDLGLIINSSLSGAGAIVSGAALLLPFINGWGGWPAIILTALLATVGILFQARDYQGPGAAALTGRSAA